MYLQCMKNNNPRIFMIIGGSFNGKTEQAMKYAIKHNAVLISRSDIRKTIKSYTDNQKILNHYEVNRIALKMLMTAVGHNQNIVLDGDFTTVKNRRDFLEVIQFLTKPIDNINSSRYKYLKNIQNYLNIIDYSIIGVYIKPNYKLAQKRNKQNNFPINIYQLEGQYCHFTKPKKKEGFAKIKVKKAR